MLNTGSGLSHSKNNTRSSVCSGIEKFPHKLIFVSPKQTQPALFSRIHGTSLPHRGIFNRRRSLPNNLSIHPSILERSGLLYYYCMDPWYCLLFCGIRTSYTRTYIQDTGHTTTKLLTSYRDCCNKKNCARLIHGGVINRWLLFKINKILFICSSKFWFFRSFHIPYISDI